MKEKKATHIHANPWPRSPPRPLRTCVAYILFYFYLLGKSSKSVKKTSEATKKTSAEQKSKRTSHKNDTKIEKKRQPSAGAAKGLLEDKIKENQKEKTTPATIDAEENHKSFEVLPSADVPIPSKQEASNVSSTKAEADKSAEQLPNEKTIITMADVHTPQPSEQQGHSSESPKDVGTNDETQSKQVTATKLTVAEEQASDVPEIKVTRETPEPRADNQDKNGTAGGSEEQKKKEQVDKDVNADIKASPAAGTASTSGGKADEPKEGNVNRPFRLYRNPLEPKSTI